MLIKIYQSMIAYIAVQLC